MTTIEKIRAEIKQNMERLDREAKQTQDDVDCGICIGYQLALNIIDKYAGEPCEDAKSTKAVMKILTTLMSEAGKDGKLILSDAKEMIMDLPNVQPKQKGGE